MCARHTGEKDDEMGRNPPIRTTKDVHLTLPRELAERLRASAAALGLTESEYVGVLVRGERPIARPGADMQDVALAGNRIVRAITALATIQGSDDVVRLLREAQRYIANELQKAQPAYAAALTTHVKDDAWSNE